MDPGSKKMQLISDHGSKKRFGASFGDVDNDKDGLAARELEPEVERDYAVPTPSPWAKVSAIGPLGNPTPSSNHCGFDKGVGASLTRHALALARGGRWRWKSSPDDYGPIPPRHIEYDHTYHNEHPDYDTDGSNALFKLPSSHIGNDTEKISGERGRVLR